MTMKFKTSIFSLAAVALLPNFSFASTDAITASFERDLQHTVAVQVVAVAKVEADPLNFINITLNTEVDAVVASFERDQYRAPTTVSLLATNAITDPLVDAINIAFYGQSNQALADFVRDFEPTQKVAYSVAVNEEVDPLMEKFSAVLWNGLNAPKVLVAVSGSSSQTSSN
ncbi:MAG: hypothetical protein IPN22_14865 [Bacteroidetes bacterium]|nr:hypothetical protein [Bacteroidota bacterium]